MDEIIKKYQKLFHCEDPNDIGNRWLEQMSAEITAKVHFPVEMFHIYRVAVNQIDDLFEYQYKHMTVEEIKNYVVDTINQITLAASSFQDKK